VRLYDTLSFLFKLCCPYVLPIITHLINYCIEFGVFPDSWKEAVIIPLPKKFRLLELKDLRPISIFPVISKIFEKAIALQIKMHLKQENLLPLLQSGFRSNHSCATALLKISDDIFHACDNGQLTLLVLLDFSIAFDTINHEKLGVYANCIFVSMTYTGCPKIRGTT
jgi:hypothetical protein